MKDLIVAAVLWALVIAGFNLMGGIGSAGDAIRSWGRASAGGSEPKTSST